MDQRDNTSGNEHSQSDDDHMQPKRQKKVIDWVSFKNFENVEEKNAFLEENPNLKVDYINKLKNGTNTYLYCNIKSDNESCQMKLRLLKNYDETKSLLLCQGEHNHVEEVYKGPKLDPNTAKKIEELHDIGHKPRMIARLIADIEELKQPKKNQVKIIMYYFPFDTSKQIYF